MPGGTAAKRNGKRSTKASDIRQVYNVWLGNNDEQQTDKVVIAHILLLNHYFVLFILLLSSSFRARRLNTDVFAAGFLMLMVQPHNRHDA